MDDTEFYLMKVERYLRDLFKPNRGTVTSLEGKSVSKIFVLFFLESYFRFHREGKKVSPLFWLSFCLDKIDKEIIYFHSLDALNREE